MSNDRKRTLTCASHDAVPWRGDVACAACGRVSINASGTLDDVHHPAACVGCGSLLAREARICCRACALPLVMAQAHDRGCV